MLCRETLCVSDGIADRAFCLGQQATPLFVGMVVGWCTDDVLVATLDDQQMAVLNTADEFDALATLTLVDGLGEVLVQVSRLPPLCVMIFPSSRVMILQRMAKSSSAIS